MRKTHQIMNPGFLITMMETSHEVRPGSDVRLIRSPDSGDWKLYMDSDLIAIASDKVLTEATKLGRLYFHAQAWRLKPSDEGTAASHT